MARKIKVRNIRNGSISHIEEGHWNKIKDDPQWRGVFKPLETPEPPEVKEVKERKKKAGTIKEKQAEEEKEEVKGE